MRDLRDWKWTELAWVLAGLFVLLELHEAGSRALSLAGIIVAATSVIKVYLIDRRHLNNIRGWINIGALVAAGLGFVEALLEELGFQFTDGISMPTVGTGTLLAFIVCHVERFIVSTSLRLDQ